MQRETSTAPVWNAADLAKVNLDSVLAILKVSSPQKIDSLKGALAFTYDKWDSAFAQVSWDDDFTYLSSRLNAIEPADIHTLDGLQTAYSTLEKVYVRIDSLGSFVSKTKGHLAGDLSEATTQAGLVDDWITSDYKNALAQAKLPSLDKASIAQFFFGDKVVYQAVVALSFVDKARGYSQKFGSNKPKKEKPPRLKGQTIYFTSNQRLPDFWIKNIELSGETMSGIQLDGRVKHIVSNQKTIGQPTIIAINGSRNDGASILLNSELNYLGDAPAEIITAKMVKIPLKNIHLSDSEYMPDKLTAGNAAVEASFAAQGDSVAGDLDFIASQMSMTFDAETSDPLQQTIRKIFENAKTIDVKTTLQSTSDNTRFHVNSNLDNLFSKEIEAIVGKEVAKARSAIEDKVASQVKDAKLQFDDYVAEKTDVLEAKMQNYEDLLKEQIELVESKKSQLEKRISEEQSKTKKSVEGEAKKRIKGLFD